MPITIDLTDALANKDVELYKDYKTASVAIPFCRLSATYRESAKSRCALIGR